MKEKNSQNNQPSKESPALIDILLSISTLVATAVLILIAVLGLIAAVLVSILWLVTILGLILIVSILRLVTSSIQASKLGIPRQLQQIHILANMLIPIPQQRLCLIALYFLLRLGVSIVSLFFFLIVSCG